MQFKFEAGKYLPAVAAKTVVSSFLVIIGLYVMLTRVFIPVVDTYANSSDVAPIISPIAEESDANLSANTEDDSFKFQELNASFREEVARQEKGKEAEQAKEDEKQGNIEQKYFYLSIPSLDIEDAKVEINSPNLDPVNALGHYTGSCLPNEACNSFVYGHSTFKGVKNRYKQGDYTAIFSHLDELEYGDEFTVKYDGKEYQYMVELTKVDRPENVDPLAEPLPQSLGKHESTMLLFTCTPSGTTKYRLSVVGRLVNVEDI